MAKPDNKATQAETEAAVAPAASSALPLVLGVGFVLVAIMIFALPTLMVTAAGMVPTIVAAIMPADGQRRSVAPVALMNLAGIASVLGTMWRDDNSVAGAMTVLSSPFSWLIILAAVGLGLALRSIFPSVATSVIARAGENNIRRLKTDQKALVAEWGAEVRQPAKSAAKKAAAVPKGGAPAAARPPAPGGTARQKRSRTVANV